MGYPMTWRRLLGRNPGLSEQDARRLESDQRDEAHLRRYAELTGATPEQVRAVLDLFFGSGAESGLYALRQPGLTPLGPHETVPAGPGAAPAAAACDHGVTFDCAAAAGLPADEVRRRWPRLFGPCPKGCGYCGIAYASTAHYLCGDW